MFSVRTNTLLSFIGLTASLSTALAAQQVRYSTQHHESTHSVPQTLQGSAEVTARLQASGQAISVVTGDFFTETGRDLVMGYAIGSRGALVVQRANSELPQSPTPEERISASFSSPFAAESSVIDLPVRPDLLVTADVLTHGQHDLLVAAKGSHTLYLLAGAGKGSFSEPQAFALNGKLGAVAAWSDSMGQSRIAAGVCGDTGCGIQFLDPKGATTAFVPIAGTVTSIESAGGLNAGKAFDLLVIADGKALLLDGDAVSTGKNNVQILPVSHAVAATSGFFIYSFQTSAQLAVLDANATLHILSRQALNPHQATLAEGVAARRGRGHRLPEASRTGLPWQEVETTPNFGPGGESALLLHGRFTGSGIDDLAVLAGSQYVELSHPSVAEGAVRVTTPILTVDSSPSTVVAAVPARVTSSGAFGLISADKSSRPLITPPSSITHKMTVNTTADPAYTTTGANAFSTLMSNCSNNAGLCTLRAAVAVASNDFATTGNGTSRIDEIDLPAGTYTLTSLNSGTSTDGQGSVNYHLDVDGSVNIVGAGSGTTFINAANADMVMSINSGITGGNAGNGFYNIHPIDVFISNVTIENGKNTNPEPASCEFCDAYGGDLNFETDNSGNLTLMNVVVANGNSPVESGGGLFTSNATDSGNGTIDIESSTFSNNIAAYGGGGFAAGNPVPFTVNNSAFTSNTASATYNAGNFSSSEGPGGAIYTQGILAGQIQKITNTSFTSNQSIGTASTSAYGGAIFMGNNVSISGSTFTNNTSPTFGGAIYVALPVTSSILSSTFLTNTAAMDGGAVCLTGQGTTNTLTMTYNRLHGNMVTGSSYGSHKGVALGCGVSGTQQATLAGTDNWWGCNGNPSTGAAGCDTVGDSTGENYGTYTVVPYTTLTLATSASSYAVGTNVVATASLGQDSSGTVYSAANDAAYLLTPITAFTLTDTGTVSLNPTIGFSSSAAPTTSNAAATATAMATTTGTGTATVSVDGQTVTRTYTITAPDLTVSSSHTGNFKAGDTADAYTLTVGNVGTSSTSATVTVKDTLPSGFTATAAAGSGWTCSTGTTVTCTSSATVASSVTFPAITVTVTVSSSDIGTYSNSVAVSGGGQANTTNDTGADSTIVVGPPTLSEAFNPATIVANGTSTVTLTLGNPSANSVSLTGVGFTDTLPSGLVVQNPSGAATTCSSGAITAANGGSSITLSGASVAAGANCTVTVNVTSTASGSYLNTTGNVSAMNSNAGGTASATLTVTADTTSTTLTLGSSSATVGDAAISLSAVIKDTTNTGTTPAGTVTFTDTLSGSTTTIATITLSSGSASTTYMPSLAGSHTITATYNPSSGALATSADSKTITIAAAATAGNTIAYSVAPGNSLLINGIFSYPGAVAPTGAVTFKVNGSSANFGAISCTNKAKHTNCSSTYTAPAGMALGSYPLLITLAPDSNYAGFSISGTLTVTTAGNSIIISGPVVADKPSTVAPTLRVPARVPLAAVQERTATSIW